MNSNSIQLKQSCILNVPIQNYDDPFTFVVNGEEFKTTKLISDLISPKISKIHQNDPTFDTITINTLNKKGHFPQILKLLSFNSIEIPSIEIPFISEVIEFLETELEVAQLMLTITSDNAFTLIQNYRTNGIFYGKFYQEVNDFISSHFNELCESHFEEFEKIDIEILHSIIQSKSIKLNDEDQLLKFVNKLYSKDSKYSILYEEVYFINTSSKSISEFVNLYDLNDITQMTWLKICERLKLNVEEGDMIEKRYNLKYNIFSVNENNPFDGIINHLKSKFGDQIFSHINLTSSSIYNNEERFQLKNIILFDNPDLFFHSDNSKDSWICFDFKNYRVIPTDYTIKSEKRWDKDGYHPKNWVIEGSNDQLKWILLDERKNCSDLKGRSLVHTFKINNSCKSKKFQFIRFRQIGKNWKNDFYFIFDSFEIYGTLIQMN